MINAVLAAEDDNFFQHGGVDYPGLIRATARHLLSGEKVRRRQHDHDAARARPVPQSREELSPQADRDLHDVPHRAGADEAGNPRAVSQQDVSRTARLRRRRRGRGLLRQDGRSAHAAGDRADRRHVPAAVARQPGRERGFRAATSRVCAATHAREGIHHAGRVRHRAERAGRIALARTLGRSRSAVRRRDGARRAVQPARRRGVHRGLRSGHHSSTAACRARPCVRCARD